LVETSCSSNEILANDLSSNDYGIYGYASSGATLSFVLPNKIYHNNLIENDKNAHDDTNSNLWYGNFWADYTGAGPYAVPGDGDARDNSPLTAPYEAALPIVTTTAPAVVEETGAALKATLVSDGGEPCEYRFQYGPSPGSYTSSTAWDGCKMSGQTFEEAISGLSEGSKYYFRAQARNRGGTASSSELGFVTKGDGPTDLKGDFDGDGHVTLSDFIAFAAAYGSSVGDNEYDPTGDFDDDGDVDLADFIGFANVYGT
jgi:hypothetical protein